MAIGASREDILHSTLKELKMYDKAFDEQRKIIDADQYLLGEYVFEGVSAALANMFRKRGQKAVTFQGVREKPLLQMVDEEQREESGGLSDEEKKRRTEQLFTNLEIMASNFRLQKAAKAREEKEKQQEGGGAS